MTNNNFLPQRASYENLLIYKKSECLYVMAYYFAHKYLGRGDRTVDQMIQAARSCKQNIVEGCKAGVTSKKTELHLTNVAKASLHELKEDFKDYLVSRNLEVWASGSEKFRQAQKACSRHNDKEYFMAAMEQRSPATIANIGIILANQEDYLLFKYIEYLKKEFLEKGGISEQMTAARIKYRKNEKY